MTARLEVRRSRALVPPAQIPGGEEDTVRATAGRDSITSSHVPRTRHVPALPSTRVLAVRDVATPVPCRSPRLTPPRAAARPLPSPQDSRRGSPDRVKASADLASAL